MIRSFLAIELPEAVREKIGKVQEDLRSSRADVRWVSPEKIHLTLKFLGNIEEARIEPVVDAIGNPVRNSLVFSLKVEGIGAFPHWKDARVIWTGLSGEKQVLIHLQKEIEMELAKIGFEPEGRVFQPHLTLGRVSSSRGREALIRRMERYRSEEFGDFTVERVILFKSDLKPTGPVYTPLREVRLSSQRFEGGQE